MHAVSNAINILNSNIDAKICKIQQQNDSADTTKTKCINGEGTGTGSKFSGWFGNTATNGWKNGEKGAEPWGEHNAGVVSKDTAALTREEKGVVSSVFAKVIEGAEILQRILSNIHAKICKAHDASNAEAAAESETTGTKCVGKSLTAGGLSHWFSNTSNTDYKNKETQPWHPHNAKVVSKDTAELSREEKGVVSSVFAKVIEGAEILEGSLKLY